MTRTFAPADTDTLRSFVKSTMDRAISLCALVLLLPLFFLVAIAIKIDSPGPVLYRQPRTGKDGKVFQILKFRSMITGADLSQAQRNDPRVTRVGAILRKTSIDELPQLVNILLGDMAIVGPRPHAVVHDLFYAPRIANYMLRYSVKPGLTGWAQINNARGETETVEKMARRTALDLKYIRNRSILLDLRIILATPLTLLTSNKAY
jgi:putative colanic acid biosynthesis UDP-glucose lipid carrier transferase